MIQKEKKESYNKDICYAKTTKKMIEILYAKTVLKTHHDLRWMLLKIFLKINDKFHTIKRNISYVNQCK